jgi:nitrate reductase gamma subunit
MRLFGHVPVTVYREYVNGVLAFGPYLPAGLDTAAARWSLGIHLLLANVLIFYFPLSRLMHVIGSLTMNLIRSEHLGSERN